MRWRGIRRTLNVNNDHSCFHHITRSMKLGPRIGSGIGQRVLRLGYRWRPLPSLEDAVAIIRPLLRGEVADHRGIVFSAEGVSLGFRPPRPDAPIYVASMGDRSLALCGRIADGLIVSNMCPPRYTERAVGIVQQSAADARRKPLDIVQYVPCVVRQDRDEAWRLGVVHRQLSGRGRTIVTLHGACITTWAASLPGPMRISSTSFTAA